MIKFFKKQNKKGFSLVETLVALFVFSIAIIATMTVMSQGISNINSAKKKVTASFLAQEGIEYVRNMKDTSMLFTEDKIEGWESIINLFESANCLMPASDGYGCYFNNENMFSFNGDKPIMQTPFSNCYNDDGDDCIHLKYDEATGNYGYTNGVDSGFARKIIVYAYPGNEYIGVDSIVYWKEGGITKKVSFTDYLTNWAE